MKRNPQWGAEIQEMPKANGSYSSTVALLSYCSRTVCAGSRGKSSEVGRTAVQRGVKFCVYCNRSCMKITATIYLMKTPMHSIFPRLYATTGR
jgi:hypothetical protein